MKILLFDTETTGLYDAQICQLSYIIYDTELKRALGKNFFFTVDKMEPGAEKVHGLSMEKLEELSGGLRFKDKAKEFLRDARFCDIIVGHNIKFDCERIADECGRIHLQLNGEISYSKRFCTMYYFTNICKIPARNKKTGYKFPRVEETMNFLNISSEAVQDLAKQIFKSSDGFHDARFDITATLLILLEGFKQGYIANGLLSDRLKPQETIF